MSITRFIAPASAPAITDLVTALELIGHLARQPTEPELLYLALGADQRPLDAYRLRGVRNLDAVIDLVAWALEMAPTNPDLEGVIVALIHPGPVDPGHFDDITDRWHHLDDLCTDAGLALIEWLVVTPSRVLLPREAAGLPSRLGLDGPGGSGADLRLAAERVARGS